MKRQLKFFLILIVCLFANIAYSQASHCYSYTIKSYFELFTKDGGVYLQETIKDGNGVTYVSRETVKLQGISDTDFEVVADGKRSILFKSEGSYYLVEKSMFEVENYGINKIFKTGEVEKTVSTDLFKIGGSWYYMYPVDYSKDIKQLKIPNLKGDFEILADFGYKEFLIKNNSGVYIIRIDGDKATLEEIAGLNPEKVVFRQVDYPYDNHFIYDDNHFYLISIRFNYTDITSNFTNFGKKYNFTDAELVMKDNGDAISLDTKDGYIWGYVKAGIGLKGGGNVKFYPLQASYLNKYKEVIAYNDHLYIDPWNAAYERDALDVTEVKRIDRFHKSESGLYTDNVAYYYRDYKNSQMRILPEQVLSVNATNKLDGKRLPFFMDNGYIKTVNLSSYKLISSEKLNTPIKDFGLIFAYNKKLVIENTEIPDITNTEKLEFIGSTVDVINPCDGFNPDNNTYIEVKAEYNYFFRDDKQVYSYRSGNKNLVVLSGLEPQDYGVDSYEDLIVLTQKMNRNHSQNNL